MLVISTLESNFSRKEGSWCFLEGGAILHEFCSVGAPFPCVRPGLYPAGSTYEECSGPVSIAPSLLPCLSPEKGKTFQMGKRRGHQNWNSVAAVQYEAE